MFASRQSSSIVPQEIDCLHIDVSIGAISELISFNTHGDISSGSKDLLLESSINRSLKSDFIFCPTLCIALQSH